MDESSVEGRVFLQDSLESTVAAEWTYLADDLTVQHQYRLRPETPDADGNPVNGEGSGPSGAVHHRFRAWKEDLLGR